MVLMSELNWLYVLSQWSSELRPIYSWSTNFFSVLLETCPLFQHTLLTNACVCFAEDWGTDIGPPRNLRVWSDMRGIGFQSSVNCGSDCKAVAFCNLVFNPDQWSQSSAFDNSLWQLAGPFATMLSAGVISVMYDILSVPLFFVCVNTIEFHIHGTMNDRNRTYQNYMDLRVDRKFISSVCSLYTKFCTSQ